MTPQDKTTQLKQLINQALKPLIESDFLLLDLPYHSNLGDTLIWQGELDFLKALPYKCRYSTWLHGNIVMAGKFLRPETILLFHGGGNFGDVWTNPNNYRKRVIAMYPKQKAIILPQTVYYNNEKNLVEDAAFYSQHPNVTICARDKTSLELLKKFFPKNPSFLVPDMAFCMDMKRYNRCKSPQGAIFIRRKDKEFKDDLDYTKVPEKSFKSDWLLLDESKEYKRQEKIIEWGYRFDRHLGTDWHHRFIDLYWYYLLRPLNIKTAITMIDTYDQIYTTRMHAAILSVILGKSEVTLFDNNYGKSSSLYHTWLEDVNGLKLVE